MKQRRKILWQNTLVGYMDVLGAEMRRIYGRWHPVDSDSTIEFLTKLRDGEELIVLVEKLDGEMGTCLITSGPDDELGQIEVQIK